MARNELESSPITIAMCCCDSGDLDSSIGFSLFFKIVYRRRGVILTLPCLVASILVGNKVLSVIVLCYICQIGYFIVLHRYICFALTMYNAGNYFYSVC